MRRFWASFIGIGIVLVLRRALGDDILVPAAAVVLGIAAIWFVAARLRTGRWPS